MEIRLITAVHAMQAKTTKLLIAHTSLAPIHLHIGSIKKELIPSTTYKSIKVQLNNYSKEEKGKIQK